MQRWKEHLTEIGDVRAFDYDYMREGRRRPDRLPQLIAAHRAALAEARQRNPTAIILIGKSMGSRIGCHVSLVDKVDGLICFGYPLHGAGDPSRIPDEVLRALVPFSFFRPRDPLCPLESLEQVRAEMKAPTTLHVVEGGDHSLLVSKRHLQERQETQSDVDRQILGAISAFLRTIPGAG